MNRFDWLADRGRKVKCNLLMTDITVSYLGVHGVLDSSWVSILPAAFNGATGFGKPCHLQSSARLWYFAKETRSRKEKPAQEIQAAQE